MGVSDGSAHELLLDAARGQIWHQRPKPAERGVLVRLINSRRRCSDPIPVPFQIVAFSGDGLTCAAADKRGHLYLIYLQANCYSLVSRARQETTPTALCFTRRTPEEVLCGSRRIVRVFDVETHRNTAVLHGHRREIQAVAASGSNNIVITQSHDLTILWNSNDWTRKRSLDALAMPMHGVDFSPNGDLCGILFRDSRISLWRTATFAFDQEILLDGDSEHDLGIRLFALGDQYVVAAGSGKILFWDLSSSRRTPLARAVPDNVVQLKLGHLWRSSPDNVSTAIASDAVAYVLQDDGVLRALWVDSLRTVFEIRLGVGAVITACAASLCSRYMILAVSNGSLELRDVPSVLAAWERNNPGNVDLEGNIVDMPTRGLRSSLDSVHIGGVQDSMLDAQVPQSVHRNLNQVQQSSLLRANTREGGRHYGIVDTNAAEESDHEQVRPNSADMGDFDGSDDAWIWHTNDIPSRSASGSRRNRSQHPDPLEDAFIPARSVRALQSSPKRKRPTPRSFHELAEAVSSDRRSQRVAQPDSGGGTPSRPSREPRFVKEYTGSPSSFQKKMKQLLDDQQSFLGAERPDIWRRLLQLPNNRAAYEELAELGTHPRFRNLRERYPAHSSGTIEQLMRLLSAIAHWSPAWARAQHLPSLAFPFLKVFNDRPVLAFEAAVSLLQGWARDWADDLPGPPLTVLAKIEELLASADPTLHNHLQIACETPEKAGSDAMHLLVIWPMLRTLMTEVLAKKQWLQLWDHLVTHWMEPELLPAAIVAFMCTMRASLLELPPRSPQAVSEWLRQSHKVRMPDMVNTMYSLWTDAVDIASSPLSRGGPLVDAKQMGRAGPLEQSPSLPLAKGLYPVWPVSLSAANAFPSDLEAEHDRNGLTGSFNQPTLDVSSAVDQVRQSEARFRRQQEELLHADEIRRKLAVEEEDRMLQERRSVDEQCLQKRLQQVRDLYTGVEKSLEQQQQGRAMESKRLLDDIQRRHKVRAYELEMRLKEEAILSMEMQGAQSASELLRKRRDEEGARALTTQVRGRSRMIELKDSLQQQKWKTEDETERVRVQALQEWRVQQDTCEAEFRRRREVQMELRLEELEHDLQLSQVARERMLRRANQRAKMATETFDDMQRRRHELISRTDQREQAEEIAEKQQIARSRERQNVERPLGGTSGMQLIEHEVDDRIAKQVSQDIHPDHHGLMQSYDENYCDNVQQALPAASLARGLVRLRQAADSAFATRGECKNSESPQSGGTLPPEGQLVETAPRSREEYERRERQLEFLIAKREEELDTLWRDFDQEAKDFTDEVRGTSGATTASIGRAASTVGCAGGHRIAGPLGGTWGDSSDDDVSSGVDAGLSGHVRMFTRSHRDRLPTSHAPRAAVAGTHRAASSASSESDIA